jgi:hypothetical protein
MEFTLRHGSLEVILDFPGSLYKGPRFDWNGRVRQVLWEDHVFCSSEHYGSVNDGCGLCNEFDIEGPAGFAACPPGAWFTKIGVGELYKPDAGDYDFFRDYFIRPADFEVSCPGPYEIVFICTSGPATTYPYQYIKKVYLRQDELNIEFSIRNTGTQTIRTTEYCHNFISIDHHPLGPDYMLKFDNPVVRALPFVDDSVCTHMEENRITWKRAPESDFYFSNISPDQRLVSSWNLEHKTSNVGISEACSFLPVKCALWGRSHVVSPELFYALEVPAVGTAVWKRQYKFYQLE